jgi:hypothetical protein
LRDDGFDVTTGVSLDEVDRSGYNVTGRGRLTPVGAVTSPAR